MTLVTLEMTIRRVLAIGWFVVRLLTLLIQAYILRFCVHVWLNTPERFPIYKRDAIVAAFVVFTLAVSFIIDLIGQFAEDE